MTVSGNGRFIHAVYPHNYFWKGAPHLGFAMPRQFEMTTPWDISTAGDIGNMHGGFGEVGNGNGNMIWGESLDHGVHWSESGEKCYFSFVQESSPDTNTANYKWIDGVYKQSVFNITGKRE